MGLGGRPRTQANVTTFETSRTRRALSAGRPHPAACTVPALVSSPAGPRGLMAIASGNRPSSRDCWSARPGEPSFWSHGVTSGGARPTRTQRRTPTRCFIAAPGSDPACAPFAQFCLLRSASWSVRDRPVRERPGARRVRPDGRCGVGSFDVAPGPAGWGRCYRP